MTQADMTAWDDTDTAAEWPDDDFQEDAGDAEGDMEPLGVLGKAAERLRLVLEQETALARTGGLGAFADAIREKRAALAAFNDAKTQLQNAEDPVLPSDADRAELQRLMTTADENALVLEAVRNAIDDLAGRLRKALTAGSDPGTYGPTDRRPRHAIAARLDTRI